MIKVLKKEDGMVLANSIVILATLVVLGISLITLILTNSAFINKSIYSSQALYLAEAGIEKAMWELNQSGSVYEGETDNTDFTEGTIDVVLEDIDGSASKYIVATAYSPSKINPISTRTVRVRIDPTQSNNGAAFHYGVQVGDLGLTLSNNAKVYGNVFSNGNISGGNGSLISGDAFVAGIGNSIRGSGKSQRISIGNDANAHTLQYLNITNDAYYFSNATLTDCSVGGTQYPDSPILGEADLPFSGDDVDDWKDIADNNTIEGDYEIDLGQTESLGPVKINGDLLVSNLSTLNLTGVIWVTGNIEFSNNAVISLDPSYGSDSGMIIASSETDPADYGKIEVTNNVSLQGSGEEGSYIMLLSENTSFSLADPAILAGNNSDAVVYYSNTGIVEVNNNADIMSVYGRGLHLSNGAEVHYDEGLADTSFSTGPGGIWVINSRSWERL